jgi:hypothetical protein
MTTNYKRLFTISILHEFFRDGKCKDLQILPAPDTKDYFRGMGLLWRRMDNYGVALIRDNGVNEPYINTPPAKSFRNQYRDIVFRFYVSVQNHLFFNYTNTNVLSGTGKKFYFSNLASNELNGLHYISQPVPAHANGVSYEPGSLVTDSSGTVYESIRLHTSTGSSELTDESLWQPKGLRFQPIALEEWSSPTLYEKGQNVLEPGTSNVFQSLEKHISVVVTDLTGTAKWSPRGEGEMQYASPADLIESCARTVTVAIASSLKAEISVFAFNYDGSAPAFDRQLGETITEYYEQVRTVVQVDMTFCKPGRYLVNVNGVAKTVYYDPAFAGGNIFGVIEIFNHLPDTNAYSLLDADEKIKDQQYVLQFPNRRVLWKYLRSDGRADEIKDVFHPGYAFVLTGNSFVSPTPLPLSETPNSSLELTFSTTDFRVFPLPNPNVYALSKYNQDGYDYLCSEIFLNY